MSYGGQAVIEGVLIRGKRTLSLACRRPNGEIYLYRERLDSPLHRTPLARAPFVRGIFVLGESLTHGIRMLQRSADIQLEEEEQRLGKGGNALMLLVTGLIALGVFVGIPYATTGALHRLIENATTLNIVEGFIRLFLFLGYLGLISLMPEIRRVFQYHGAEHMTIHAYEHQDPLDVEHVRPYPTAHPRCGTAFLLIVAVIAIALFTFMPRANPIVDLAARLALVIPVAAIAYEVLKLGAAHERNPLMRFLVVPGLLLQRITTRRPDDGMIEVAIASLQEAVAGDAEAAATA